MLEYQEYEVVRLYRRMEYRSDAEAYTCTQIANDTERATAVLFVSTCLQLITSLHLNWAMPRSCKVANALKRKLMYHPSLLSSI